MADWQGAGFQVLDSGWDIWIKRVAEWKKHSAILYFPACDSICEMLKCKRYVERKQ